MKVELELNLRAVLRWVLGLLLVWASLGKLANLQEFYGTLSGYGLPLPGALLRVTAVTLPWLELVCGLLLVSNCWTRAALSWTAVLFAVFAVATGQAWMRGLHISCGCLDLRLIGISDGSAAALFIDSLGFAMLRALALGAVAVSLLAHQKKAGAAS
jgi:putative oxidoreductase